jgi:hypothetical protein
MYIYIGTTQYMQKNMWERRTKKKKGATTVILPIMLIQAPSRLSRFFTTFILCLLGYIMFFGTVNAVTFDTEVVPHNFLKGFQEGLEEGTQEATTEELREEIIEKKWDDIVKTCKDFHRIYGFFENQVCNNMAVGAKVVKKECEVDAKIKKSKSESMKVPKTKMDDDERSGENEESGENEDESEGEYIYNTRPKSVLYYEVLGTCDDDVGECLSESSTLACCKIDEDQKKIQRQIKRGLNHLERDDTLELLKKVKRDFATVKSGEGLQFGVIDQNLETIKSRMRKANVIKKDMEEKIKEAADSMREDLNKIKGELEDSEIGDRYKKEASQELNSVEFEEAKPLSYEVRSECEKEL